MKYGIIGRTAEGIDLFDGQTVKTRVLAAELKRSCPESSVIIADTYNYKKNPVRLLKRIVGVLRESDVVFVLLSRNGRKVIFPIVNSLNRVLKKPILHDCIGGAIADDAEADPRLVKCLNRFSVNWVESEKLKQRLIELGVKNAEYLPNFKRLECLKEEQLVYSIPKQFRFCTFSRVNEAKGIGKACEAVIKINNKCGFQKALLSIYGPIEQNYDAVMNQYIDKAHGAIEYCGVAAPDKSVETLKGMYALLFPTVFYGEGFPGTLIDAFSSGVPVIATDWHLNGEIISDGYTGFLYDVKDEDKLAEYMEYLINNPEVEFEMRKNCLKEAGKYSPEIVMETIMTKISETLKGKNEPSA